MAVCVSGATISALGASVSWDVTCKVLAGDLSLDRTEEFVLLGGSFSSAPIEIGSDSAGKLVFA
jgi:hypothetical protein